MRYEGYRKCGICAFGFRGLGVYRRCRILPKLPKVSKIMAQNLERAIILHAFGVQVAFMAWGFGSPGRILELVVAVEIM